MIDTFKVEQQATMLLYRTMVAEHCQPTTGSGKIPDLVAGSTCNENMLWETKKKLSY